MTEVSSRARGRLAQRLTRETHSSDNRTESSSIAVALRHALVRQSRVWACAVVVHDSPDAPFAARDRRT